MNQIKTVIIVDDSALIRDKVKSLVSSLNTYRILAEASSGKHAVEQITYLKPDVVILDIKMPDITGIEVLKSIQHLVNDITVIIFSNYSTLPYQTKCFELGADYYLDKTKDFNQLRPILI